VRCKPGTRKNESCVRASLLNSQSSFLLQKLTFPTMPRRVPRRRSGRKAPRAGHRTASGRSPGIPPWRGRSVTATWLLHESAVSSREFPLDNNKKLNKVYHEEGTLLHVYSRASQLKGSSSQIVVYRNSINRRKEQGRPL